MHQLPDVVKQEFDDGNFGIMHSAHLFNEVSLIRLKSGLMVLAKKEEVSLE
jgi:hypothetical protein